MILAGVSSSKRTTRSTGSSAARSAARSSKGVSGRPGPLSRVTPASPFTPTMSASPSARAERRSSRCPRWRRSKQPFVKTTLSPRRRASARKSRESASETTRPTCLFLERGEQFVGGDGGGADFADGDAGGMIGQHGGLGERTAGGERRHEGRDDRVPRAGDVVHLERDGGEMGEAPTLFEERHAVLAARHEECAELEAAQEFETRLDDAPFVIERPAEG